MTEASKEKRRGPTSRGLGDVGEHIAVLSHTLAREVKPGTDISLSSIAVHRESAYPILKGRERLFSASKRAALLTREG